MKMPNINATKAEYQKEIGLNLDMNKVEIPHHEVTQGPAEDPLQEARDLLPEGDFYKIVVKDRIQIIDDYHDRCPLLELRKQLMRARVYINRGAQLIMMHSLFESISITVIVVNSLFLAMDDPLQDPSETPKFMNVADDIFQYLYTIEMVVKIVSLGFILNKGSYLRDAWNILDFIIIASGYLGMFLQGSGANLQVLRSFRVIRPLRTISSIQGLRVIVASLMNALPLLRDSLLVLMFFFLIFAIAGCQLFTGALKQRCFAEDTGLIDSSIDFCGGDMSCNPGYYCAKSNENPSNGATNYDNVMFAMLQVFQVVTMEGWTAIMVALQMSVGTWICAYFYPIIFIGAFFLLNLTLAVIKAKFTEEMENKKEAAKPKRKKLDDAPLSSEDEDLKAEKLLEEIEKIHVSNQMSPRTKQNKIDKLKIEYMIKRTDKTLLQREVQHKIVERIDDNADVKPANQKYRSSSTKRSQSLSKSKVLKAVDKISILNPAAKAFSFAKKSESKTKVHPQMNYSDVFYSASKAFPSGGAFLEDNIKTKNLMGQTYQKRAPRFQSPIREDDEEQDQVGLLAGDDTKRRRNNGISESQNAMSQSLTDGKKGFFGTGFEVGNQQADDNGKSKKLVFAGINNSNKRLQQNQGASPPKRGVPLIQRTIENDSHIKKAIYEKITKNFDIFEFLDENNKNTASHKKESVNHPVEGDNELSDELEFEIDEDDMFFDTEQVRTRRDAGKTPVGNRPILDLNDDDDEEASHESSSGQPQPFLKRGSTQATAAENRLGQKNSGEQASLDNRYISPFNNSIRRQASLSPKETHRSQNKAAKKQIAKVQPELQFNNKQKGFLRLFAGCKKIKAKRNGKNFKEEYLLLKKRPSSSGREAQQNQGGISRRDSPLEIAEEDFDDKTMSIRAKSNEVRRKRLLAESLRFILRNNVMRQRRAQFFAPAIKCLGIDEKKNDEEYEKYVFEKRKIDINPDLMDEEKLRKRVLYRSASAEAVMRQNEYSNAEAKKPGLNKSSVFKAHDLQSMFQAHKNGDHIDLDLQSQRSLILDQDYKKAVQNYKRKELELNKYKQHEYIPDMERILHEKELKIVVKLSNLKFSSVNDIFEQSGPGRFMNEREKKLLAIEEKKKAALKLKLPKRVVPREMILGYQKKIFVSGKTFHEELLRNEFIPSDEDQDGMLTRIEEENNYDHRSHIFVTGTISVVVNKPHADNKIMNGSYNGNIKIIEQAKKQYQESGGFTQVQELISDPSPRKVSPNVLYDRDKPIQNNSILNNLNLSHNQSVFQSMIKMKNNSKFIFSAKRSQSVMSESASASTISAIPPKPEQLTDKQIVKRLNQEVERSHLFQAINIRALPQKIIRHQEIDKNLFKKRKRKEQELKQQEELELEDDSEDSQTAARNLKKDRKFDYFVDLEINGYHQINVAKDQANHRHKDRIEWSGQDIMTRFDPYKARIAVSEIDSIRVWPYSAHGLVKMIRVLIKAFLATPFVEHGMTVCVLGNTVVLSLDFYGASQGIQDFCATANTVFTLIFAAEMGLRIIGSGAAKYLADKMNYMDGIIVILSLVELIFMSGSGAMGALRSVRIMRVFRILRVARLLRGMKSMVQIINVISRSVESFIYLAMLLMLFIFIYALLGMQMFGGVIEDPEVVGTVRYNFDSFNNAFITSFILLTTENWNTVMFFAFSGQTSQAIIAVYFVSCIFIGNWMLLNLFLAILLDAFTNVELEDMMTPEKKEMIKQNMLDDLKIKEGEDFIEGMGELQKEGFVLKAEKKHKKKKKKTPGQKSAQQKQQQSQQMMGIGGPAQGNLLLQSQEIDLQTLQMRDQELLELRKQLFRGIECKMSCYILSQQNPLRIFCYKVLNHSKFESFIMLLIVGSSFKLVFDTYTDRLEKDDPILQVGDQIDLAFQILFTMEMVTKIIAFGFVMDEGSYLTEAWNKLDCFIVVSGLIDTSLAGVDIPVIKVLRLLRILRPLRFVSHSSSMKTLIEALIASMGSIANVGVVILIVFLMFAILGVNLFAGKLQYCDGSNGELFYLINNQAECFKARGSWTQFKMNMDNVAIGMLTLFIVSNNEGWPDVMYAYSDATGVETGPKPGAGILNAYFFVFFVFVGSFFFLNLFVGVLFLSFEKAQRDEKDAMLLDGDEVRWVDMMKMICSEKSEIIRVPKNKIRLICYNFVAEEGRFANFIMACIILNIFTMAATFEGQSDAYSNILEKINYFFTAAFALECGLKLIAHGGNYFGSAWNKFDFFVVSASFLDIVMANLSANSLKVIRVGPQLARVMRVMRVTRLFKLLNKYKGLQALMQTIQFSLPSVINAFALLSLVYFIFSVLGVFFFKDITAGDQIDDYMNYSTFSFSLMMMLRESTGEDWPAIMFDCMNTEIDCIPGENCGSMFAPVFYLLYVLIQQYIMVNLFILIILQQFDLYYLPDDNVLDRFKRDVTSFKIVWKEYSKDFEGFKIRSTAVGNFFKDLKGDLGMSAEKGQKAIERNLVVMNIQADDDGFIYFNELLFKTMKRRYMPNRTKKKILFEMELNTLEKLERIMKEQIYASRKKERQKAVAVNPFLVMMYKNMSFNVWSDIYQQNLPMRQHHIELGLDRQVSEEDEEEDPSSTTVVVYETEEDVVIDEFDKGYLEMQEREKEKEAARADPLGDILKPQDNLTVTTPQKLEQEKPLVAKTANGV